MAELNAIHPFREGNGRTQRVFVSELAREAGHVLDFTVVSRERMIAASVAANEDGDPAMMRRLFRTVVVILIRCGGLRAGETEGIRSSRAVNSS